MEDPLRQGIFFPLDPVSGGRIVRWKSPRSLRIISKPAFQI